VTYTIGDEEPDGMSIGCEDLRSKSDEACGEGWIRGASEKMVVSLLGYFTAWTPL
jgi:hypothetical protein